MSNRKKVRAGGGSPRGNDAGAQQAMLQVLAGLQTWSDEIRAQQDSRGEARRAWCGGTDPVPAELPAWPADSVGDRFFSSILLDRVVAAPCLAAAAMPDARVMAAESAHWNVATSVLVRAILLDGVPVDDPAVMQILDVLAPVAEAELAYGQAAGLAACGTGSQPDEPEFPEQDGPVFLVGGCALIDATCAVIGTDSLREVLGVLTPLLGETLPELDGQVLAEALVRSFSHHYRPALPGDEQVLERLMAGPGSGDPLQDLVAAGVVAPADALRVGLTMLHALAALCQSASPSVLQVAA